MKIDMFVQHPSALPVLAGWYYEAWGREAGLSLEDELAKLTMALRGTLPLILVAMDGDEVIGCVQIKEHELSQFPHLTHWLGSVYVAPHRRGSGIARKLISEAVTSAKRLKIKTLHLQTEEMSGGLYRQLGWEPLLRASNHGIDVLVMARELDPNNSFKQTRLHGSAY